MMKKQKGLFTFYLRLALGISLLSAVADRFGLWGKVGQPNVFWGNMKNFTDYVGVLVPFAPHAIVPALAWISTTCEIVIGILLILGFKTRITALLCGYLVLLFSLGMTIGLGFKSALDYSAFSASAGAFVLYYFNKFPYSLDSLLTNKKDNINVNSSI